MKADTFTRIIYVCALAFPLPMLLIYLDYGSRFYDWAIPGVFRHLLGMMVISMAAAFLLARWSRKQPPVLTAAGIVLLCTVTFVTGPLLMEESYWFAPLSRNALLGIATGLYASVFILMWLPMNQAQRR
ncbi:hypothetical protein [Alkalicoccus luteus]|uniref:hypothetical protein n=1 Tax=Alkalicoccus luteus TaxID=1237094 RepID=UPI004034A291